MIRKLPYDTGHLCVSYDSWMEDDGRIVTDIYSVTATNGVELSELLSGRAVQFIEAMIMNAIEEEKVEHLTSRMEAA